jgi:hypothetical protein
LEHQKECLFDHLFLDQWLNTLKLAIASHKGKDQKRKQNDKTKEMLVLANILDTFRISQYFSNHFFLCFHTQKTKNTHKTFDVHNKNKKKK